MITVGQRLRTTRQEQQLSLTDVATKAGISAATLSRIETQKQNIDLGLFLSLAKILKAVPHELLADSTAEINADPLARKIAALGSSDRTRLWRDLAQARRKRTVGRREMNQQLEELLAQLEYLKQEMESIRTVLKRRR